MPRTVDIIVGLVSLIGGVYALLLVYRVIPLGIKEPEKVEQWHHRFDKILKITGPICIIFGILMLIGIL